LRGEIEWGREEGGKKERKKELTQRTRRAPFAENAQGKQRTRRREEKRREEKRRVETPRAQPGMAMPQMQKEGPKRMG
jgi:hypothetical protein